MTHHSRDRQMRARLAQEAARIIIESGSHDFLLAKRKAAAHLGATDTHQLPSNQEIEQAVVEYQRLFRSDTQPQLLRQLRTTALDAMAFFQQFDPRLVGPVLTGTADTNTPIQLHVFTDTPEDISFVLMEHRIPFENIDRSVRINAETHEQLAGYRFIAHDVQVEVLVFPVSRRLPTPLSPVDGKPMQRASREQVEALLDHTS